MKPASIKAKTTINQQASPKKASKAVISKHASTLGKLGGRPKSKDKNGY